MSERHFLLIVFDETLASCFAVVHRGYIKRTGYCEAVLTCFLATRSITVKISPVAKKALSPQAAILKDTSVKLLAGYLKLQTSSIMTLSVLKF